MRLRAFLLVPPRGIPAHPLSLVSIAGSKKNVPGSNLGPTREDEDSRSESVASSISTHSTHADLRKQTVNITDGPQPDSLKASEIPEHDILDLEQTPNNSNATDNTLSPSTAALPASVTTESSGNSRKRSSTDTDLDDVGVFKCSKLVADQQNLALSNENQRLKARLAMAQSNEHDRKMEAEGDGTY